MTQGNNLGKKERKKLMMAMEMNKSKQTGYILEARY